MTPAPGRIRLVVYTRKDCGLCEEFLAELSAWAGKRGMTFTIADVDDDPADRQRFGLMVPVLVVDGQPLLNGRFDADVLDELPTE